MDLKTICQKCQTPIAYPDDSGGQSVPCPGCGQWVFLSAKQQPAPQSPVAAKTTVSPARTYLKNLRSNSCYTHLRSFIQVLFWLAIIGSCLPLISTLGVGLLSFLFDGERASVMTGMLASTIPLSVTIAVLGVLLSIVTRQAMLLLVDIADTLIDRHSRQ